MPIVDFSPITATAPPNVLNALSAFSLTWFSMRTAESDSNRAPDGFEAAFNRRLSRAYLDVHAAAKRLQSLKPEGEVDILKREVAILSAALLRYESAFIITARVDGRIMADDPA